MNARKALIAVSALSTVALTSCGTLRRAGKDVVIGALTPAVAIYGGATDGFASAKSVRNGLESGSVTEVISFPFTFLYHTFEHTIYCVIHIVDLFGCPFYGLAEIAPNGSNVTPLDFYTGTWFDKASDHKVVRGGTDSQTGEPMPESGK
ncbi:MAG TPA: hypothetical protein VFZ65_11400 [Planctomycetota bacterium]|nr:hypothetical protein [Planctomycetota bacterium]